MKLYAYSGECRLCECGLVTKLKSDSGDILHTGDIVMIYTVDKFGVSGFGTLTAIVSDQYQSYSDGRHVLNKDHTPFVMGIKGCVLGDEWHARKVKSYVDVIDKEHWKAFGFNYKEEGE